MNKKSLGCGGTSAFFLLCLAIRILAKGSSFAEEPTPQPTVVINPNQDWINCQTPVFEALNPIAEVWNSLADTESCAHFCSDGVRLQAMLIEQQSLHTQCGVAEHEALGSVGTRIDCALDSWLGACASIQRYCDSEESVFLTLADAAYREGLRCMRDAEIFFDEYLESQQ